METVERLQRRVRDYRAGYKQSLFVLEYAKSCTTQPQYEQQLEQVQGQEKVIVRERPLVTKTSLMLGLGEQEQDLMQALRDLRSAGVDVVTFGQYLRPTQRHMSVQRYVTPEEFDHWRDTAQEMGFKYVASGPLVRSSYRAGELYLKGMLQGTSGTRTDSAPAAPAAASANPLS